MEPVIAQFDPFCGAPRLHGARIVGCRPATELIHPLAATGSRPMRWDVSGLPEGIAVDRDGILRGIAPGSPSTFELEVSVSNPDGHASGVVELRVGDALALTPPMGWNSWNVFGADVSAEVITQMADAMVDTGMRDLGYSYINIDDHWHAHSRAPDGAPQANPDTFPDGIGAVADHVHSLGLKLGIYSDAGRLTCGRCFGGYGHEALDARTYAEWGVDLLKYDYCYAPKRRTAAEARYATMGRALADSGRSIVYSVCEWGLRKPWEWAPDVGASLWRTTPDIFDTFSNTILGVRGIARRNMALAQHAGPGRWNDPDMLLVGNHGEGGSTGRLPPPWSSGWRPDLWRFRGISDVQAHTHVTLWAMMAAPLLASHDLRTSSERDLWLLRNPDVIAINQDPLGLQATRRRSALGTWLLTKELADGSLALSISNVSPVARTVRLELAALGLDGPRVAVDPWSGRELGVLERLEHHLPRHGSEVVVLSSPG